MITLAERLQKLPPYLFVDLRQKMTAAKERGVDVISLGIGDPDYPTPDPVVETLCNTIRNTDDADRHRYGCDSPVSEFPEAVAKFYQHRFGVSLSSDQIVTTLGSKDAIVKMAMGILNPGDIGIAASPGYPTYNIGHVFASATTYYAPLLRENNFLIDFEAIPDEVKRLAKVLWINYPNNPTTATADLDFFERAVEFGRENNILIAHDNAYSENTYDGYTSPSILQVDGADEVAVEFFSLSKAFNMTGWRLGFVVGNATAVEAVKKVKDNIDNGSLRALQFSGAKALSIADEVTPKLNTIYQKRRDMVVDALTESGWDIDKPKATMYIWAPVPEQYNGSSREFATALLENAGVVVTPGLGYGQWSEGYYRISLTYPDQIIEEAISRIRAFSTK
ncbi:MAG: aminotransferase class I/II-fold pyridoxal phosphate-dependent enzyme [Candidatus Poribacteria bacterium]|nr:aminotransferase class I/II-fold pyridoxal phosphate-dependent enzyme [Candidatus Poribacteria bacterium]